MKRLKVFSVGGTIDKIYFDALSDYQVGEPQIEAVFHSAQVGFEFQIESLMRKDSLEMTEQDRTLVREAIIAEPCQHILVTHGTDTMAMTAEALQEIPDKVIVLTGSLTPARFQGSDATFNIGFAVGALSSLPPGAYLAMNGQVFPAGTVRKNREQHRFESLEE